MRNARFKIRMALFPRRPAFKIVFQVNDDKVFVRQPLPDELRLCPDMLDIEVPVVPGFHFLTHRLFRCISIGQGKKSDDGFFML